jgi:hypothetical protein
MSLALYWAVSTGLWDAQQTALPYEQRRPQKQPKKVERSRLSLFKRGLRSILKIIQFCLPLPPLWQALKQKVENSIGAYQKACGCQPAVLNSV